MLPKLFVIRLGATLIRPLLFTTAHLIWTHISLSQAILQHLMIVLVIESGSFQFDWLVFSLELLFLYLWVSLTLVFLWRHPRWLYLRLKQRQRLWLLSASYFTSKCLGELLQSQSLSSTWRRDRFILWACHKYLSVRGTPIRILGLKHVLLLLVIGRGSITSNSKVKHLLRAATLKLLPLIPCFYHSMRCLMLVITMILLILGSKVEVRK